MRTIQENPELVARCGLYCGACRAYLKEKCEGCAKNLKATWCGIRACCGEKELPSCADCQEFTDVRRCGKFNNFMSKFFALIFRSDRPACIEQIRRLGLAGHAKAMAAAKLQSLKRGRRP